MASDLLSRFRQVDVSSFPDVHMLEEDLDVALWVLLVAQECLSIHSMTAAEVGDVATAVYRRRLTRQRASAVLSEAKEEVSREARSNPTRFFLLRPGIDRIRGQQNGVIIVDPEASFTALRKLDQLLAAAQGEVLICDPYVDDKTLLALASISKSASIKLLSMNVSDPAQFRRKLQAYAREYGNLELRTSATPDLHDRYLIDQSRMWLFGQSLNGIGKKQTFIVAAGQDVRAVMEPAFRRRWTAAPLWT